LKYDNEGDKMWPEILRIGPVTIYSFGLMAALAFLITGYLLEKQLTRVGYSKDLAGPMVILALIGGFAGAKIYFFIEHPQYLKENLFHALFSGEGLVWYGGLIGGFLLVSWYVIHKHLNYLQTADLIAPLLLLGQAIGRIGCFLSGDGDYGPPSDVPWAMAFPDGVVPTDIPVHPTPLYDTCLLFFLFLILWRLRKRTYPHGTHFGLFLIFIGIERFITEFWRTSTKHIFKILSEAQLISLFAVLIGSTMIVILYKRKRGKVPLS
jgi:phosphatidylglycerol:prolipoprotein diacylglycerol transferase